MSAVDCEGGLGIDGTSLPDEGAGEEGPREMAPSAPHSPPNVVSLRDARDATPQSTHLPERA